MLRTLKVLFLVGLSSLSFAQKNTHTPYSVFGLGELKMNDYAAYMSMGGVSMAASDSTIVNHANPASYSFIGRYRPILQIGLDGRLSTFETSTATTNQRFFSLNQFQLGIPIRKRWGAALGIKPYSFTGYQVSNYVVEDADSTALYTSEGSGGVNKFYLGVAYQPVNHTSISTVKIWRKDSLGNKFEDSLKVSRTNILSIGANANYLFGATSRLRTFQYATSLSGLNSKVNNSLRFSDMIFDFGVNYQYSWTKSKFDGSNKKQNAIAIGITYSPKIQARAFQDLFSYSYLNFGGFNGSEILSDTIEFVRDNQGTVTIPETYKAGFEYRIGPTGFGNSSQLKIAGDVRHQRWSTYNEDFGATFTNELKDRTQFGFGLEYTPVAIPDPGITPFFNKIHYRIGGNYTMTELRVLNNLDNYTDLTAYGMSFGLGIPINVIPKSNTNINFGMNLGNLGTTDDGLIREKYIGLFFGISITPGVGDLWFLKRKYD
ncbi:MAG: hypothetical protein ACI857_001681 [Arenicella sp.]|jgi:hypothetical protein